MIKVRLTQDSWLFSCIYASSYRIYRCVIWENLKTIKDNYEGNWLIRGDFNEIIKCTKKRCQTNKFN